MTDKNQELIDLLERKEKLVKASFYKKNGLSSGIIYLAILAEFLYITTILDVMPVSFLMGFATMLNIFLLFMFFTCAVKISVYSRWWTYAAMYFAIYVAFRTVLLIPFVLEPYEKEANIYIFNAAIVVLLLSGFFSSLHILEKRKKITDNK